MKKPFCMLMLLILVCSSCYAGIREFELLVVGMPETVYSNKQTKVRTVLTNLWGEANCKQPDAGWQGYTHTNSAVRWRLYIVTLEQIKQTPGAAKLSQWKSQLDNHPKVKAERTWDLEALVSDYGLAKD